MCERARRSRDSSSRYSIDTLFPGLGNGKGGGDSGGILEMVIDGIELSSPCGTTHSSSNGTLIQHSKARRVTTKGVSRSGSSTRDSVNLPRDDHDNGTNLSRLVESTTTSSSSSSVSLRRGKPSRTKPPPPCRSPPAASKARTEKRSKNPSSVKTCGTATKRRASSPLKPTSLPKQITPLSGTSTTRMSRIGMQEAFQPFCLWVLATYGDAAKTKTITRKKCARIIKTLRGEEINNAENSKFRFWVKAKGFHIGLPPGLSPDELGPTEQPHLYVPTTVKDENGIERPMYKRVAIVEQFFDIIYTVHVETEAKNGKHAGQKRTYRAITEKYAFLPREAVTKFLLQCTECQKRGSPNGEAQLLPTLNGKVEAEVESLSESDSNVGEIGNGESQQQPTTVSPPLCRQLSPNPEEQETKQYAAAQLPSYDINFSLPFTTTYLRRHKKQMRLQNGLPQDFLPDEDDSRLSNSSSLDDDHDQIAEPMPKKKSKASADRNLLANSSSILETAADLLPGGVDWLGYHPIALKKDRLTPNSGTTTCSNNNSIYSNGKNDFKEQSSPISLNSAVTQETGQDETSSNGNKEDEDDDDDESEDKIDPQAHDPERLKAFNMFVRLFVDENLDRMVPISKQPKEKIQAIIDSCTRQFPEFAERARKRIRTYLKSCRRNKRSRDSTWESSRPTPAHLTSVQAEQILAQACENESQNAKRMRMGLEPVGQPLPASASQNGSRPSSDSTAPVAVLNGNKDEKDIGSAGSNASTASTPEKVTTNTKATAAFPTSGSTSNSGGAAGGAMSSITGIGGESRENGVSGTSSSNVSGVRTPLSSSGSENQISTGAKAPPMAERNHLLDYSGGSRILNGNALTNMSMYRPNFCQAFTRPFPGLFPPAGATPPATGGTVTGFGVSGGGAGGLENCLPNGGSHNNRSFSSHNNVSSLPIVANGNEIGPTDLSMKSKPLMSHKLNTTEMSTVRQLITGYRESAAFLLRSADELEQLIQQQ